MRKTLPFIVLLMFAIHSRAQTDDRNIINFSSTAFSTSLTAAHGVFFTTRAGEVAVPAGSANTWRWANPEPRIGMPGLTLDNINFFNNDTGFVSGFIAGNNGLYNTYYHTTDGGMHWNKLHFADAGWADKVVHLNNGKAWASIAGTGHIDYSTDYGFTWQQINIPHVKERYASIYFNTANEGIIGSLWNVIDYTADNGKTWRHIPTPLDDHAYKKTDTEGRPEINQVGIFNNHLIVMQEGMVFASARDSIHWQHLPYDNFTEDNNTGTLFFTSKNAVIKAGDNLQPIKTYTLNGNAGVANYNNGLLTCWNGNILTTINNDGVIKITQLYTNDKEVINPTIIGYTNNGIIGCMGNKLYTQKTYNDNWKYKATLPFAINGRQMQMIENDSLLVKGPGDSLLYYNLTNKKTTITTANALLADFCKNKVEKIIFETGSQGCFHYYANNISFERDDNTFVFAGNGAKGSGYNKGLTNYPDEFPAAAADSFIKKLPVLINQLPSIQSTGITSKDVSMCRAQIIKFKNKVEKGTAKHDIEDKGFWLYKNNIDFNHLLSLPDSVVNLPPTIVDSLLNNPFYDMVSTTSDWVSIRFILEDGSVLLIANTFYNPNSLHFPWTITLKGLTITRNAIAVNQFVNNTYPAFIAHRDHTDIVEKLVKILYDKNP